MNTLSDFPADQFRILGACDVCDHTKWLDRDKLPDNTKIDDLGERLACQACGSRNCGVRIVYARAGEFQYR